MFVSWNMGPALAAGNTVLMKPSEIAPLSTLRVAELMARGVTSDPQHRNASNLRWFPQHELISVYSLKTFQTLLLGFPHDQVLASREDRRWSQMSISPN
jgi:Aldehyde dehydrogenase family